MPEAQPPQGLRCDPFLAIAVRLSWLWGAAAIWWHLGSQWTPWHPGPDWGQIGLSCGLFAWGLAQLVAFAASSVTVDRAQNILVLRRFGWQGQEERLIGLGEVAALVLVPQSGPGRYLLPPPLILLRLRSLEMVKLGTIASIFFVADHAQTLAVAIGCGVETPGDD